MEIKISIPEEAEAELVTAINTKFKKAVLNQSDSDFITDLVKVWLAEIVQEQKGKEFFNKIK